MEKRLSTIEEEEEESGSISILESEDSESESGSDSDVDKDLADKIRLLNLARAKYIEKWKSKKKKKRKKAVKKIARTIEELKKKEVGRRKLKGGTSGQRSSLDENSENESPNVDSILDKRDSILDKSDSFGDKSVVDSMSDSPLESDKVSEFQLSTKQASDFHSHWKFGCPTSNIAKVWEQEFDDSKHGWFHVIEELLERRAKSKLTRKKYLKHLKKFAEFCQKQGKPPITKPGDTRRSHFEAYEKAIRSLPLNQSTLRSYLIPITSLGSFLKEFEVVDFNYSKIIKLGTVKYAEKKILSTEDMDRLLDYARDKKRDAIAFMYFTGLRAFEVAKIKNGDLKLIENPQQKTFYGEKAIHSHRGELFDASVSLRHSNHIQFFVKGKGGKKATIDIKARGTEYLKHICHRKDKDAYVFPSSTSKTGHVSERTIQRWVKGLCKDLEIEIDELKNESEITPHSFRHTAITAVYERSNNNLLTAKEFARHGSVQTTETYLHANKEVCASALL